MIIWQSASRANVFKDEQTLTDLYIFMIPGLLKNFFCVCFWFIMYLKK